jgi:hypothetical protein
LHKIVKKRKRDNLKMYYMHMGEQAVLDGVKKFGPSAGGKAMMDFEYVNAQEALETGIYVTYWCDAK